MKSNHLVSIPLDPKLAEFIGKRGSENSITFYNRKTDDAVVVAIAPSSLSDKFYALPETMLIAEQIIISTLTVDKAFGEVLVAASLLSKRTILTDDNDVSQFVTGLGMNTPEVVGRELVLEKITSHHSKHTDQEVRVDIDKAFPVKGVGTILLGIVTKGTLKVHDKLYHGSGKEVVVRSIQSQDIDVQEAERYVRVGIAAKGIEYDEVEKGDILLSNQYKKSRKAQVKLNISAFTKQKVDVNDRYGFVSNFSYVDATVESIDGDLATLKFEKDISLEVGDEFMLMRSHSPRVFASGTISGLLN